MERFLAADIGADEPDAAVGGAGDEGTEHGPGGFHHVLEHGGFPLAHAPERRLIPVEAAFFATVDPATLLFTGAVADDPLASVAPHFLANELGAADVNRFAVLAGTPGHVRSLDEATGG